MSELSHIFEFGFTVCEINIGPTAMANEFPVGLVERQLPRAQLACGNFVVIKFVDSTTEFNYTCTLFVKYLVE